MFKCKKLTIIISRGTKWIRKRANKSKTNKAWRHGIQLDVKLNKLHKNFNKVKNKQTLWQWLGDLSDFIDSFEFNVLPQLDFL